MNGLKDSTPALGQIFDKNQEAENMIAELDEAIGNAKAIQRKRKSFKCYSIRWKYWFLSPGSGRVWGPCMKYLAGTQR